MPSTPQSSARSISFWSTTEAGDSAVEVKPRDAGNRLALAGAGTGAPGFDDVDTRRIERAGDIGLVVRRQRHAGGLLAITQRRVEKLSSPTSESARIAGSLEKEVTADVVSLPFVDGSDTSRRLPAYPNDGYSDIVEQLTLDGLKDDGTDYHDPCYEHDSRRTVHFGNVRRRRHRVVG